MAAHKSIAEISRRFGEDRLEIVEYVKFMSDQCAIHVHQVSQLNVTLDRFGLPKLSERDYLGTDHHLTPGEIEELVGAMEGITPAIDRVIGEVTCSMDGISTVLDDETVEDLDLLGEWTNYLLDHLPDDPRHEKYGAAEHALVEYASSSPEIQDDLSESDRREIIDSALRGARFIKLWNMQNALLSALDRFQAIKAIGKLVGPDAVASVLRQGFILLMTAFDAVIFDLVRIKLRKDFFKLIDALGKNEKITFQKMADAGSMDALRDVIIEEQLKKRYVKGLLALLINEWKVPCVNPGQNSERLIELILRRNIHVHNRGVVDERYLGEAKKLDNLKLGDNAFIDEEYWQMANDLCCTCVHNVGAWAYS